MYKILSTSTSGSTVQICGYDPAARSEAAAQRPGAYADWWAAQRVASARDSGEAQPQGDDDAYVVPAGRAAAEADEFLRTLDLDMAGPSDQGPSIDLSCLHGFSEVSPGYQPLDRA